MPLYLAIKEIWRNRGRFLLFSMVIALITTLVLFIAALAGGLANANRQFIEKLEADLLVYQENSDLQATSSRLGVSKLKEIRRVEGVADVGPVGISSATMVFPDGREGIDIALIGVEPGKPGDPPLQEGPGLKGKRANEVIVDKTLSDRVGLSVGDAVIIKSTQGIEEKLFELEVVGITDERQYFFQPTITVPIETWDKIRPQAGGEPGEVIANLFAVKLSSSADFETVATDLPRVVDGIEVSNKQKAILAIPGYTAQQNTLNTQRVFTLLIGVLVVGGFFQIQTLQKVGQIGMLKAIGSSNRNVAISALIQIVLVTLLGVGIGSLGTLLLTLTFPGNIPILFNATTVFGAIGALLLIGPIGGLVSIRLASKIEPLTAIGLSS